MTAATRTDASAADVLRALLDAGMPTLDSARMVAAQSALETAGWTGGMWNYNLGNITTTGSSYVTEPGNSLHFKSYPSLWAAAIDLVNYLNAHGVLTYAVQGNLAGYVQRLQAIGYAGNTNYASYQSGMQTWITKLANVLPAPPWRLIAFTTGLTGAAIAGWHYRDILLGVWRRLRSTA
jgi:hypothetical protein